MKGYEVIKQMSNMKLGTKIRRDDGQVYELMKQSGKRKFGRIGNKKGQQRFMTYSNIQRDFEVIEENKEIKYLEGNEIKHTERSLDTIFMRKIDELVQAVNKLSKEAE